MWSRNCQGVKGHRHSSSSGQAPPSLQSIIQLAPMLTAAGADR